LLFGLVNACLYSALLPLWEGFDEAFHYGYVESLWQTHRLPVLGRTLLPADVWRTLALAPVSPIVHRWFAQTIAFDAWFSLPASNKQRRRNDLDQVRPQAVPSSVPNYEAHHPPLAYLLLAPLDRLISGAPIRARVLVLRLFGALLSIVLLFFGAATLGRNLKLPEPFLNAALFTIFCSQMLYATIAHVDNDWLAVGIAALYLASLARLVREPDRKSVFTAAALLSAGLLTKAYFLAFIPPAVVAVAFIWRRVPWKTIAAGAVLVLATAGPWYARNLILYGNISGTHEEFDGVGIRQALAAAPKIHWASTATFLARGSLWTGNASFTSFSKLTLDIVLALLLVAIVLWALKRNAIRPAESVIFIAVVVFSVAVAYASCASFAHTKGDSPGASPWYSQVLLAPVVTLAYLGMSRSKRFGRFLAASTTVLWAWVLVATWAFKLFPMYATGDTAPMRVREVWNWYMHVAGAHMNDLSLLALAPGPLLYAGLVATVALTLVVTAIIIRAVYRPAASAGSPIRDAASAAQPSHP
jgi:hypothetical protein